MAATGLDGTRLRDSGPFRLFAPKTMTLFKKETHRLALAALLLLALVAAGMLGDAPAGASERPSGKERPKRPKQPNIVLITTDDQARSTLTPEAMPHLFEKLIGQGTSFTDYVVTTPLCCPSRATMLTGQYGHNNGVLRNYYPDLQGKRNVLPAWLQHAGYRTAHVGKFLNSYERDKGGPAAVAPGWDLWFTQLEKRRYYHWKASKNGRMRHYGSANSDHATKVMTNFAARWTRQLARRRDPFYMQLDYYAPHTSTGRDTRCASGPVPEPRDEHRFDDNPLPRPLNFNEEDVSDKPPAVRALPPLDDAAIENITRRYRCTLEALYGVDRGIKRLYGAVKKAGELRRTVFIFTSDNGFFYGEHRIPKGKKPPYEENIHMPLTVLVPRPFRDHAPRVAQSRAPVANIDLAPTILDLADAEPCRTKTICRTMDGRSLMPLVEGRGGWPNPRPIGIEIGDCTYRGVRVSDQIYYEYANPSGDGCLADAFEHYDLREDPHQLENLAPGEPGSAEEDAEKRLNRLTTNLRDCAGIRGRDPQPESGHYCR